MSRAPRVLAVLRHRDFGLLWAGMGVSVVGDGFYQVALVWQVYELSDTPTALAIVALQQQCRTSHSALSNP